MRVAAILLQVMFLCASIVGQAAPAAEPKFIKIPFNLDHNRIIVDIDLTLPDGSATRVRGWVDNGNPELEMSRRVATLLNLNVTCTEDACSAPPPASISIGGMKISLATIKSAIVPLKPVNAAAVMEPGMSAEINIPSSVLRNYDVLIDFPVRELTIGQAGALKLKGIVGKAQLNAENGLLQIASEIENKKYNFALDLGSSISFLSAEIFDRLATSHAEWSRMVGAVGPANMWGLPDEPKWKLLRLERVQFGPLHLTDVPMVEFPADRMAYFEKRAGIPTAGLIGSEALLNYRVGLDYAHSAVYFDIARMVKVPDFDLIGLTLRPEDDGRFTILGVADFDGKPSVPDVTPGDHLISIDDLRVTGSAMGQVWSLLTGSVSKERRLVIERDGKQFTVVARVRRFLPGTQDKGESGARDK